MHCFYAAAAGLQSSGLDFGDDCLYHVEAAGEAPMYRGAYEGLLEVCICQNRRDARNYWNGLLRACVVVFRDFWDAGRHCEVRETTTYRGYFDACVLESLCCVTGQTRAKNCSCCDLDSALGNCFDEHFDACVVESLCVTAQICAEMRSCCDLDSASWNCFDGHVHACVVENLYEAVLRILDTRYCSDVCSCEPLFLKCDDPSLCVLYLGCTKMTTTRTAVSHARHHAAR